MRITTTIIISWFLLFFEITKPTPERNISLENYNIETIKFQKEIKKVDERIIRTIKEYYQITHGKNARLEESIEDTTLILEYYSINDNDNWLFTAEIPLIKASSKLVLEGDINNDDKNDFIINIYTSGGGTGGNVGWVDFFTFLQVDENYKLVNVTPHGREELSGCDNGGSFNPVKIENNFIIGYSVCYQEKDPNCCPSLTYESTVVLKDNRLIINNMKLIEKKEISFNEESQPININETISTSNSPTIQKDYINKTEKSSTIKSENTFDNLFKKFMDAEKIAVIVIIVIFLFIVRRVILSLQNSKTLKSASDIVDVNVKKIIKNSQIVINKSYLTGCSWILINEEYSNVLYTFRSNGELLITTNGLVEKCQYESIVDNDTMLITHNDVIEHFFIYNDKDDFLYLQKISSNDVLFFANQTKYKDELKANLLRIAKEYYKIK